MNLEPLPDWLYFFSDLCCKRALDNPLRFPEGILPINLELDKFAQLRTAMHECLDRFTEVVAVGREVNGK